MKSGKGLSHVESGLKCADVLRYELTELGVEVVTEAWVSEIVPKAAGFLLFLKNGEVYQGDRVIIATGGRAMPASGSDGSGYDLVKRMGHTITDVFPALVQLKLEGPYFKRMAGRL